MKRAYLILLLVVVATSTKATTVLAGDEQQQSDAKPAPWAWLPTWSWNRCLGSIIRIQLYCLPYSSEKACCPIIRATDGFCLNNMYEHFTIPILAPQWREKCLKKA